MESNVGIMPALEETKARRLCPPVYTVLGLQAFGARRWLWALRSPMQ